jgi:hypothetical protein
VPPLAAECPFLGKKTVDQEEAGSNVNNDTCTTCWYSKFGIGPRYSRLQAAIS